VVADEIAAATALALAAQRASKKTGFLGAVVPLYGIGQTIAEFPDAAREVALAIEKVKADAFDAAQKAAKDSKSSATGTGGSGKSEADKVRQELIKQLQEETRGVEDEYKNQTNNLKRQYDLQLTSLEDFTNKEIAAEQKRFADKRDILLKQRELEKNQSGRDKVDRELWEAQQEQDRNIQRLKDERDQKEIDSLRAHRESLLQLGDTYDRRSIASIQALADRQATSYEAAEQRILEIQTAAFNRRLAALAEDERTIYENAGFKFDEQGNTVAGFGDAAKVNLQAAQKISDQIKQLTEEQAGTQEEGDRKIEEGRRRDVANEQKYVDDLQRLRERNKQDALDVGQEYINDMVAQFGKRRDIIEMQTAHDLNAENARYDRAAQDLARQRAEVLDSTLTREQKLAKDKELDESEETEAQRHALAMVRIQEQDRIQKDAGYFSGESRGVPNEYDAAGNLVKKASAGQNAIAGLNYALCDLEKMGKQAFGSFAQALGQTVQSFVLLGSVGPHALRKITASVLAELAAQATVKAIMAFADGLVTLFVAPEKAAADFAAAALYTSIAGVSATLGRGAAGDLFNQQQATGATGATGASSSNVNTADSGPRVITENRNQ
jgi:hypothetical protein